jgi:hypothetical protein
MRILIASPPKTGNVWLKCMLGSIYDLKWLKSAEIPPRPDTDAFKDWVKRGGFRDGTIFHQHYDYSEELCRAVEAIPAHLVTIIRDPYDAFVSTYFTIQQRAADGNPATSKSAVLAGKPLDHPDVLAFLESGGYLRPLRTADDHPRDRSDRAGRTGADRTCGRGVQRREHAAARRRDSQACAHGYGGRLQEAPRRGAPRDLPGALR